MDRRLVAALVILVAAVAVVAAIFFDLINVGFLVGPYRFSHWMSWTGTLFVAIYAPAYHLLKRARPRAARTLLDLHSYGFLISFLLISIHFAGQMSRPPQAFPELGEGVALYVTMILLVMTGLLQRFGARPLGSRKHYNARFNRTVHVSLISAFYVVIAVHVLSGLDII